MNKYSPHYLFRDFLAVLIYRVILDISYVLIMSKVFAYNYYILNPDIFKIFESYTFLIVIFFIFRINLKFKEAILPGYLLTYLLFLISYVPFLSLYALSNGSRAFFYGVTCFWILLILMDCTFPKIHIRTLKDSKPIYFVLTLMLNLVSIILIFKYLGFSLNFNLSIVYDIRSKYIEAKIPFAGYLFNWLSYAVNPLFISYSYFNKKWINIIFIVFIQLLLFSQTGMKSFLFAPVFVIGISWLINKGRQIILLIPSLLSLVILLGNFSYLIIGDIWISALFTNRTLFFPASLSFIYYDFFSRNGFIYLSSHKLFSVLFPYPYTLDPARLIGSTYFYSSSGSVMAANNGIIADAYMNFGFLGFFLFSFAFVLILKIINGISENNIEITAGLFGLSVLYLSNSSLLTCLFTHGLAIAIFLTYLLPGVKKDVQK